jgi:hypothetical protein
VEQVVIPGRDETGQANGQRNLCPVPDFVQQDVEKQLSRRDPERSILNGHHPHIVSLVVVEQADELLELAPH